MQITGKNLQKAVVLVRVSSILDIQFTSLSERTISLSTGNKLPKYGLSEATEQILDGVRIDKLHSPRTVLTLGRGTMPASTECQMLHL